MQFEQGHIYHIYNQGNNRQRIFFKEENYAFFLRKMKKYILPYADVLAWCLMPNHFHWMVYVHSTEVDRQATATVTVTVTVTVTDGVIGNHPVSNHPVSNKKRNFNDSIAILLRSYSRAISNQENRSGALFREETKAECLTLCKEISPSFIGSYINISHPEKEYPQICFHYIHSNPMRAGLVQKPEDWKFSSFQDVIGTRNGKLINRQRINEFELKL